MLNFVGISGTKIYAVPTRDTVEYKDIYKDIFMWYNFKSQGFNLTA